MSGAARDRETGLELDAETLAYRCIHGPNPLLAAVELVNRCERVPVLVEEVRRLREVAGGRDLVPLDMILSCPMCGMLHVDAPEPDKGWTNPPHKSHLCHGCGCIWRPADVPTNGVCVLSTIGSADTWTSADQDCARWRLERFATAVEEAHDHLHRTESFGEGAANIREHINNAHEVLHRVTTNHRVASARQPTNPVEVRADECASCGHRAHDGRPCYVPIGVDARRAGDCPMSAEPLSEEDLAEVERMLRRPVSMAFAAAAGMVGRLLATIRARDEKTEALRKTLETAIDLATRALEQAHMWRRLAKIHVPAIDKEREP